VGDQQLEVVTERFVDILRFMAIVGAFTMDCHNALEQATFWAGVLGWEVGPYASKDFAIVGGPKRPKDAANLLFISTEQTGVTHKRNHMDLQSLDLASEVPRLLALGATIIHEREEDGVRWYTLSDPEGNEFFLSEQPQSF
jgi:hypothetical protein